MSGLWLNIGCGRKHLKGFINMDIVQPYDKKLDVRKGLPYLDQTVDGIYSEHFLEHLTQVDGVSFLRECRRVLKPDGKVRIAMPDLDELVHRYASEDWRADGDMFKLGFDWVVNRCEMMNIAMREWGHKHVYNEEELIRIAQSAGLEPIKRYGFGESVIPQFIGCETRHGSKLIMEFTVPARTVSEMPLVSVLIPAYRVTFFQQALNSALSQTYKNIEIVVCDDSPNDDIENIVRNAMAADDRIVYARNGPVHGSLGNHLKCYSLAHGEFIKFLNDDDLLEPECIEKMLQVFKQQPLVTLVTSKRKRIDESGADLSDIPATRLLSKHNCELEGVSCAKAMIALQINFIGEPSTVMFRKEDLAWVKPHFITFGGMLAVGAGDVAMWLNLLGRGNAYYISKPLSSFRIHVGQRQNEPSIQIAGAQTWKGFIFHGRRLGFMKSRIVWNVKKRCSNQQNWGVLRVLTMKLFYEHLLNYLRIAKARFSSFFVANT